MSAADSTQAPQAPSPTSSLRLVFTLGLIALCSGLLVVSVVEWTRPIIADNHERALQQAVFDVIPGAVERRDFVLTEQGLVPKEETDARGEVIHAGYTEDGALAGIALEASGRGYADVIRILYGYDPACECIVGMSVLESQETPGLGDRIETDPDFLGSIEGLDASLTEDGTELKHGIRTVDPGEREEPGDIDGITGATVSAEAIGDMLHRSANKQLPQLQGHWSELERNE